jgi:hypothetical protein
VVKNALIALVILAFISCTGFYFYTGLHSSGLTTAAMATAAAENGSATLNSNGSVTVSGIAMPGLSVSIPIECATEANQTAKVVCAANAFLSTLNDSQKSEGVLPISEENMARWSNLPCGADCRNGIELSTLTNDQLSAALAVLKTAMGNSTEGYNEVMQIRMADDILNASGGMQNGGQGSGNNNSNAAPLATPPPGIGNATGGPPGGGGPGGYSSGTYFLAFLGTPSVSGNWILQFGGHHLAVNFSYENGTVASATPKFTGIEPKVWIANGMTYAPLNEEHDALVAMLASLDSTQLAKANLSTSFSDVLLGPGEDGQFPSTKQGLRVGELNESQKALVLAALKPWAYDIDNATAARILSTYEQELDDTYIAYSGNSSLSNHADYVRIDGPSVWIELVCQSGVVYSDQVHYHSIWRDHSLDYGSQ